MRQIMPHRNNMCLHRNTCKTILPLRRGFVGPATILQHPVQTPQSTRNDIHMRTKGLIVFQILVGARRPTPGNG